MWLQLLAPVVADLPPNVRDVWQYGATEMINNAVDHSGSDRVHVGIRRNALFTQVWVADDGEGIFFSSKVFDVFDIGSGLLHFAHCDGTVDVLFDRAADAPGTTVFMQLANDSPRTTREVFDKFAAPGEYTFAKTLVPVKLAQHEGEKRVSRSQAKRLTMRFERFQTVVLDFDGVEEIGQAFADEVFRVFHVAHRQTTLVPTYMTPSVKSMVSRARAAVRPAGD